MREEGIKGYRIVVALGMLAACWSQIGTAGSPLVDGHSHEGLRWNDGAVDTTGLQGLADRGIDVVVCLLPVDRSEASDLEQRIGREVEMLHRVAAGSGGFALVDDPARSDLDCRTMTSGWRSPSNGSTAFSARTLPLSAGSAISG